MAYNHQQSLYFVDVIPPDDFSAVNVKLVRLILVLLLQALYVCPQRHGRFFADLFRGSRRRRLLAVPPLLILLKKLLVDLHQRRRVLRLFFRCDGSQCVDGRVCGGFAGDDGGVGCRLDGVNDLGDAELVPGCP